jgi:hypothetical protein
MFDPRCMARRNDVTLARDDAKSGRSLSRQDVNN